MENIGVSAERVVVAAAVGGTTSALTGGNFANGAITAAFGRAFNDEAHPWNAANKDVRLGLASKEFNNIRPWLESQAFTSRGEAAAAFSGATQGITTETGVEVGANINPGQGGYVLRDLSVGGGTMEAATGIIRVVVPADPLAIDFIHDHPSNDTFSSNDLNTANLRNVGAYVSMSNFGIDHYSPGQGITTALDPSSKWIFK